MDDLYTKDVSKMYICLQYNHVYSQVYKHEIPIHFIMTWRIQRSHNDAFIRYLGDCVANIDLP